MFLGKTKLRLVLKALSSAEQKFGTLHQLITKLQETLMVLKFNKKVEWLFIQLHPLHSSIVPFYLLSLFLFLLLSLFLSI